MGHSFQVKSEKEAKSQIQKLRDDHPKAVHVCFAWRIGTQEVLERFSDDGEPGNSAGKPIFGQLIKYELTNTLTAVVRYYGGVNLGVGGLITAYKSAAEQSILNGSIIEKFKESELKIHFEAKDTGEVMTILNRAAAEIQEHSLDERGSFVKCSILLSKFETLQTSLNQTGKFKITIIQ